MLSVDTTTETVYSVPVDNRNYSTMRHNKKRGEIRTHMLSVDTTTEQCVSATKSTNRLVNCDRSDFNRKGNKKEGKSEEKPTIEHAP